MIISGHSAQSLKFAPGSPGLVCPRLDSGAAAKNDQLQEKQKLSAFSFQVEAGAVWGNCKALASKV